MANVMFKRGLSTALPKTGLIDGAFYLTTDTNKLYWSDGKALNPLNSNVHNVASIANLPAFADAFVGDFYYCIAENVLATKKEGATGWTQINPDTKVTSIAHGTSVVTEDNLATVTTTLAQNNN